MNAFIFLNGYYHKNDSGLVRKILRISRGKRKIIAVDGGIAFLQKIKIKPDIWLSDLDSAPRIKKGFLRDVEIKIYPSEKDKTDSELALDYCRKQKTALITIFGWYDRAYETDHLMGNILLPLNNASIKSGMRIKFIDSKQEIIALCNDKIMISGRKNERLSIVPVSSRVILSVKGVKYGAKNQTLRLGRTLSLRNEITSNRVAVSIKGKALLIIKK
ncbi:MAG: thiamine diphosphokinase [candidate division Zixibacteria bacterium]